jgi:hypothetical protein
LRGSSRWFWLALVFLTTQLVYLHNLNPAFSNDDSAETITAGVILVLQHPPGYALAAIIGRCESFFSLGSFGFRANWGASLLASLGAVLLTFVIFSLFETGWFLKNMKVPSWVVNFCAVIGGVGLAFAPTYWQNALSAKGGVYLLSVCLQLLIIDCVVNSARAKRGGSSRNLHFSFFLTGLGLASHWETLAIFIPALLLFFVRTHEIKATQWIRAFFFLVLGLSPLLYLPLRAHLNPVLDLGAPDTVSLFWADLTRSYFSDHELTWFFVLKAAFKGSFPIITLGSMLHQPFINKMAAFLSYPGWEIGWISFVLALVGIGLWLRSAGKNVLFFLLLSCLLLWASIFSYYNISRTPDSPFITLKFLLSGDWIFFLLASLALGFGLAKIGEMKRSLSLLTEVLVVCGCLWKVNSLWDKMDQSFQTVTYDYGQNLLKSLPRGSLFFAESDADYFSLYFLQQVEHRRPDVIMIPAFTLFESWGAQQIEKRDPELGLTNSSQIFSDHFGRIIDMNDQLVEKNKERIPIAFSNFNGAFHIYYMNRQKNIKVRPSGVVWLLDSSLIRKDSCLKPNLLRTRNLERVSPEWDGSLDGIRQVYRMAGIQF